jgi:hypothetical protein
VDTLQSGTCSGSTRKPRLRSFGCAGHDVAEAVQQNPRIRLESLFNSGHLGSLGERSNPVTCAEPAIYHSNEHDAVHIRRRLAFVKSLAVRAQGLTIKTDVATAGSIEKSSTATLRAAANVAAWRAYLEESIFTGGLCGCDDQGRVALVNVATLGFSTALFHATTADSVSSNRFRWGSNLSYSFLALAYLAAARLCGLLRPSGRSREAKNQSIQCDARPSYAANLSGRSRSYSFLTTA